MNKIKVFAFLLLVVPSLGYRFAQFSNHAPKRVNTVHCAVWGTRTIEQLDIPPIPVLPLVRALKDNNPRAILPQQAMAEQPY